MVRKKRMKKSFLESIPNRLGYTLIVILFIVLLGIGVYALTPGVAPNPGHTLATIAPPSPCTSGQVITWDGVNLVCSTPSANHAIEIYQAPISATAILGCPSIDFIRNGKQPCAGQLVTLSPIGGCCFYVNSACQFNGTFGVCKWIGYLVN